MANVSCPHCAKPIKNTGRHAGQVVACPHCGGDIQMPGLVVTGPVLPVPQPPPPPQFPQQQAPIFINTAPRHEPRLEAGGWFTRAFSTASGVLVALILFFVVPPILLCGGCLVIGIAGSAITPREPIRAVPPANEAAPLTLGDEATAKEYAAQALRSRGVSTDAAALNATLIDGRWIVTGTVTKNGQHTDALVAFSVSQVGDEVKWRVEEVVIAD